MAVGPATARLAVISSFFSQDFLGADYETRTVQTPWGTADVDLPPGAVVISHDFIDFTHSRPRSFFDDADAWVRIDLTEPFCGEVRGALIEAAGPIFAGQ